MRVCGMESLVTWRCAVAWLFPVLQRGRAHEKPTVRLLSKRGGPTGEEGWGVVRRGGPAALGAWWVGLRVGCVGVGVGVACWRVWSGISGGLALHFGAWFCFFPGEGGPTGVEGAVGVWRRGPAALNVRRAGCMCGGRGMERVCGV